MKAVNMVVTKATTAKEIVDYINFPRHETLTFTINGDTWTFIETFPGCGHLVNCTPIGLQCVVFDADGIPEDWDGIDEGYEAPAIIGTQWDTYAELAELILEIA